MYSKNGMMFYDCGLPFSPCYHCEERNDGCHSSCPRYAQYRQAIDEKRNNDNKISYLERISKNKVKGN